MKATCVNINTAQTRKHNKNSHIENKYGVKPVKTQRCPVIWVGWLRNTKN